MILLFTIFKEHKGFGKQILLLAKNELIKTYKGAVIGPLWAVDMNKEDLDAKEIKRFDYIDTLTVKYQN